MCVQLPLQKQDDFSVPSPNGTKAGKTRWAALGKNTEKSQQSIGVFRGKMLKPEELFLTPS